MSTPATVSKKSVAGRRTFGRSLLVWTASFLAFPAAGYLGTFIVGRVDNLGSAAIGGALVGAFLGLAQSTLSRGRLPRLAWTLATTIGAGFGVAAGTLAVDYRTTLADLAIGGVVTGVLVGIAQALALPAAARLRLLWALLTAALWPLGWVITTVAGINVEEQFIVFGSSGAIVYSVLVGLTLHVILPPSAVSSQLASPEPASQG